MICWPCIMKLEGDDELIYLHSDLDFNLESKDLIFTDDDQVIDSAGSIYSIGFKVGKLILVNTVRTMPVNKVVDLIRAHEFKKAELCLTKIHFLSIPEAINSLLY